MLPFKDCQICIPNSVEENYSRLARNKATTTLLLLPPSPLWATLCECEKTDRPIVAKGLTGKILNIVLATYLTKMEATVSATTPCAEAANGEPTFFVSEMEKEEASIWHTSCAKWLRFIFAPGEKIEAQDRNEVKRPTIRVLTTSQSKKPWWNHIANGPMIDWLFDSRWALASYY